MYMYLSFRYIFFVILGPENVCLDTMIVFLCELEITLKNHVYSGGHLNKNGRRRGQKSIFHILDIFS